MNSTPINIIPLPPGSIIENRYRIVEAIGEGGMSRVYLAEDVRLDTRVAIKENLQTATESRRQFEQEARILARLNHPNLPRVSDHFTDPTGGRQYLVMDYVEGEDLDSILQRSGPLPEEVALNWMRQVMDALSYLHDQNPPVVHRDVKPANIKITPEGKAVLVDFGIAKLQGTGTLTGARAFTPGYAPPEQYGLRTTARSDVYALGATLYTLLTGLVPPESPVRMAGETPLIPPRQVVPRVSEEVEETVLKAMSLETSSRWESVIDLSDALQRTSDERTGRTQILPETKHEQKTAKGRRRWLLVGTGFVLIAALVASWLFIGGGSTQPQDKIAAGLAALFAAQDPTHGKAAVNPAPTTTRVGQSERSSATPTPVPASAATVVADLTQIAKAKTATARTKATQSARVPTATPRPTRTPRPTATPTATIDADRTVYDNFNNPANDGRFNASQWAFWSDPPNQIAQQDEILVVTQNGKPESTSLVARKYEDFRLNNPTFFEAKLMLSPNQHAGNVQLHLSADLPLGEDWFSQCIISGDSSEQARAYCWHTAWPWQEGHSYSVEKKPVNYRTWHTVRIEADPATMTFTYYLDGQMAGSHVPVDADKLKKTRFTLSVGVWGPSSEALTGYIDDVRVGSPGDQPSSAPTSAEKSASGCPAWFATPEPGKGVLVIENHLGMELYVDAAYTAKSWTLPAKQGDMPGTILLQLPPGHYEYNDHTTGGGHGHISVDIQTGQMLVSPIWANDKAEEQVYPLEVPSGCP